MVKRIIFCILPILLLVTGIRIFSNNNNHGVIDVRSTPLNVRSVFVALQTVGFDEMHFIKAISDSSAMFDKSLQDVSLDRQGGIDILASIGDFFAGIGLALWSIVLFIYDALSTIAKMFYLFVLLLS